MELLIKPATFILMFGTLYLVLHLMDILDK